MKFNCGPTREERRIAAEKAKHAKYEKHRAWQRGFAWFPVRIGRTCVWLEHYEYRLSGSVPYSLWQWCKASRRPHYEEFREIAD